MSEEKGNGQTGGIGVLLKIEDEHAQLIQAGRKLQAEYERLAAALEQCSAALADNASKKLLLNEQMKSINKKLAVGRSV